MEVITSEAEMNAWAHGHLVPTMGALHEGHASLIRAARADANTRFGHGGQGGARPPVIVTIFVNPTQFAPHEDFTRYPRTLDADLTLAAHAGADAVFVPSAEAIYPLGLEAANDQAASWPLPQAAVEPGLEDRCRPGHFGGVCLVVARLFQLCRARRAFFGEKDWQQLRVITQMVARERDGSTGDDSASHKERSERDRAAIHFEPLEVVPCPTVREADGLAMSSRNRYLDVAARRRATALWRAISLARELVGRGGDASHASAEGSMTELLEREGFSVDYAVIRDAESLMPPKPGQPVSGLRTLIAARLGGVRLIDNAPLIPARRGSETESEGVPSMHLPSPSPGEGALPS